MKATLKDLLKEEWLRRRDSGDIYWVTKKGDKIPIKDLSDEHLRNVINILVNRNEQYEALGSIGNTCFI